MAYTTFQNNNFICRLCPHNCNIKDGNTGICSVRKNNKNKLELPLYGYLSAVNIDPIEKKPLYHFIPGSQVLSIGFYGCNFHCQFCQNYQISQVYNAENNKIFISPAKIVQIAEEKGIKSIAYTYSEPVIHFEYIMECSQIAHTKGIKNVLVTNGFLNPEPAEELLKRMDAVNVDLKAFTNSFYNKLGGKIEPVKDFIKLAAKLSHLEVTTLIIPGENDSETEIINIANFIASIDTNIPLHLSAYYPVFKYDISSTPKDTILRLCEKISKILTYVYPGNIF
ncbi:MAG: AmmeMemoRadiSam system radical SAM enzyme [Spirochaetales bacterium]|nr:AmmeMemoRadiSam system radical SAM enzyme [Spirochaetales bacterium]